MSNIIFGKIGRLTYIFLYIGMAVFSLILGIALGLETEDFLLHRRELLSANKSFTLTMIHLAGQCFLAFATSLRLRDIGKSPLFAIVVLVPVLQWLVILYCLIKAGNGREDIRATSGTQAYSRHKIGSAQTTSVPPRTQPKNAQASKVLFGSKGRLATKA